MRAFGPRPPPGALARGALPFSDNPFESLAPAALARIYEWPSEARRFVAGEGHCLHVVGDCGMGKTTVLEQIRHELTLEGVATSYTCVPLDGRLDIGEPEHGGAVLLDETDRLRRRTLAAALGVLRERECRAVLASHRPQQRAIRRAGFRLLYLELRPLGSAADVTRLFARRVALAAGTEEHPCRLSPQAAEALLRHSRGNIQRCLELGYEVFEDLERPRAIDARDVETAAVSLDRALADAAGSR